MATLTPALSTGVVAGQNVQVAEIAQNYSITTGSEGIVVPFVAEMYANASGDVGTLEQISVTMNGLDMVFDVTLTDEAVCKDLLNGFKITDLSGENFEGTAAHVKVDMQSDSAKVDAFKAAVAAAVAGATSAQYAATEFTGNASKYNSIVGASLETYLTKQAAKDTVDLLAYDTLSALLEASDLMDNSFSIEIDASGAGASMYEKMNSGSAERRRAIFTQISRANIHNYLTPSDGSAANADPVVELNFLPLEKGNKISFVFDVTVGEYTMYSGVKPDSGAVITSVLNDYATGSGLGGTDGSTNQASGAAGVTGAVGSDPYQTGNNLQFTVPTTRRVALVVKLTDGSGIFGSAVAAPVDGVVAALA